MLTPFMLTQSGLPILYAGDEIAQENDYTYHLDPDKAADSRFIHRGDFDWEKAETAPRPRYRRTADFRRPAPSGSGSPQLARL